MQTCDKQISFTYIVHLKMLLWFWIQAPSFDDDLCYFGSIQSFSYLSISHLKNFSVTLQHYKAWSHESWCIVLRSSLWQHTDSCPLWHCYHGTLINPKHPSFLAFTEEVKNVCNTCSNCSTAVLFPDNVFCLCPFYLFPGKAFHCPPLI